MEPKLVAYVYLPKCQHHHSLNPANPVRVWGPAVLLALRDPSERGQILLRTLHSAPVLQLRLQAGRHLAHARHVRHTLAQGVPCQPGGCCHAGRQNAAGERLPECGYECMVAGWVEL